MGRSKAMLPFGDEVMLQRMVRLLGEAVEPVVVVAAVGQALPELPRSVEVAHDRHEDRGPLEGLAVGLRAIEGRAEAAFVTTCDAPLLRPAFVRRLVEMSADHTIAVPQIDGHHEPLAAVYRTSVLPHIDALLAADRLRPAYLFDLVSTRRVTAEELREVDPQLCSLKNVNTPEAYRAVLIEAGLVDQSGPGEHR